MRGEIPPFPRVVELAGEVGEDGTEDERVGRRERALPLHTHALDELCGGLAAGGEGIPIANVLKDAGLTPSTSEALRMIRQGAVRIDGERVSDPKLLLMAGTSCICQVGKRRFAQVVIS